ncbi:uncharacterized protein BX664DRAFT_337225 [Halteromyces radiatus]|uniref:uncharacterized protein n=1 Tax=Halteromyces radiatus TaxID=101107 RepID=UPI00221F925A|nr:uncharacterized protein BX664DRAFT_337225 [Halteromyces radiatus]KAI8084542.1 hypothetical protein BX664DRAFT_337225 [Halteromyces radiatus]
MHSHKNDHTYFSHLPSSQSTWQHNSSLQQGQYRTTEENIPRKRHRLSDNSDQHPYGHSQQTRQMGESSQQQQQEEEKENKQQRRHKETNPEHNPYDASLLEEIKQLRLRVTQLENRASSAENGFIELTALKETEPQRQLRLYKEHAEERFAASDEEVRKLHELAKDQEQHISKITAELEKTQAELITTKRRQEIATTPKRDTLEIRLTREMEKYKSKYTHASTRATKLKDEMEQLQKAYKDLEQSRSLITSTDDKVAFYQRMTGLVITDHEKKHNRDTFTCSQSGRYGVLQFKLVFFINEEGEATTRYIPIPDGRMDRKLPSYMNDEIEIKEKDAILFLLRMMTNLNKAQE